MHKSLSLPIDSSLACSYLDMTDVKGSEIIRKFLLLDQGPL